MNRYVFWEQLKHEPATWMNIFEDKNCLILIDHITGYLSSRDITEKAFGHNYYLH